MSRRPIVYDGVRTPFGRYGGALAGVRPDDLAAHALRALLDRAPDLDPGAIDDVILGDANGAGRGQPRRRAHGGPARRPADDGPRRDRQPALRLQPRGRDPGRARDRDAATRRWSSPAASSR